MTATSSFSLAGELTIATARKNLAWALSEVIGELEIKHNEILVPAGGALTSVPLVLSSGVSEALVVVLYAPKALTVRYTSSDVSHAGPIELGIKGLHFLTLATGAGITAISVSNASVTDDVTLEYAIGAKAAVGDDDPSYWDE
jgi:hypothetical protein